METAGYTALIRQSGLMHEMQVLANNIANASTTGFRREGVIFSEYVRTLAGEQSVSMANGNTRRIDNTQGSLSRTGGDYDLALQGDGFFMVATPQGDRLTRSGAFSPSSDGVLVTRDGFPLLDAGGAPVPVPLGVSSVAISSDGTMTADGRPVAQIGVWNPSDPSALTYQSGTLLVAENVEPADSANVLQGYLEDSNVNPLSEIARMIEVQRAYEMGQRFMETEDGRQKSVMQTLGR